MITPVLPTYNRAPMAFVKGEGSWLTAEDGKRYLDLGAGIAVNALGHANPDLVAALTEQAGKLWHVSNLYRIPEQEKLAEALVDKTFADTVFFTNSGTEAAELAIKMARKYHYEKGQPQRTQIITFEGAFHGRSTGAIAAAGSEKMVKGYGPLMPGFVQVKWADHDALRAAITEAITLTPGERRLIPTGIAIALPPGYEAQVRPRSGLALKHGIGMVNAPGTIDADYRGEVGVLLINHGQQDFLISRGDRIAQLVIASYTRATWVQQDSLDETERGTGGFGHTGKS